MNKFTILLLTLSLLACQLSTARTTHDMSAAGTLRNTRNLVRHMTLALPSVNGSKVMP